MFLLHKPLNVIVSERYEHLVEEILQSVFTHVPPLDPKHMLLCGLHVSILRKDCTTSDWSSV